MSEEMSTRQLSSEAFIKRRKSPLSGHLDEPSCQVKASTINCRVRQQSWQSGSPSRVQGMTPPSPGTGSLPTVRCIRFGSLFVGSSRCRSRAVSNFGAGHTGPDLVQDCRARCVPLIVHPPAALNDLRAYRRTLPRPRSSSSTLSSLSIPNAPQNPYAHTRL